MTKTPATQSLLIAPDADYRSGKTTPNDVLAQRLGVIDRREASVKAFTALARDAAQEAAERSTRRWRDNDPLSPIDGMVIGIKDVIETCDLPTGQGSPLWEGFETRRDAASVQALREAGAIILGKTTTTEFATSYTYADTRNPHDTNRTPGGSSSGSAAAVGAGMIAGALGTQVVGSTLRPSSYCGVVGYKPSFGALNRGGSYDQLSHSCLGTLASTLSGAWSIAMAIAKRVGGDPGHFGLCGPEDLPEAQSLSRVAVLKTAGWSERTAGASASFEEELARLSAAGVKLVTSETDSELFYLEQLLAQAWPLTMRILAWEFSWPLRSYPYDQLSPTMQHRVDAGKAMTLAQYHDALVQRDVIRGVYAKIASRVDCFLTLSATGAAPRIDESTGSPAMNVPASLLGVPAVSLPILQDQNLPLGLQLIGRMQDDALLMSQARWRLEAIAP
ncbi:amidase [Devosia sp. WQ 349]|uniref:amidase n=1 Tax=Devosia sp. WQ 349K1 TaxID=2800329 RepID=UPI0019081661|nr:amidase [Devosia sp. WQ 349K1]MBK1795501.1 amidase [Devosia sp. WQ 349K1]